MAEVAELADAHDSKSCSFGSVGSIPTFGTIFKDVKSMNYKHPPEGGQMQESCS